jgi:predicted esterase
MTTLRATGLLFFVAVIWLWTNTHPGTLWALLNPAVPGRFVESTLPPTVLIEEGSNPSYDPPVGQFSTAVFPYEGSIRRWHWQVPDIEGKPLPAIVMLHGSGRTGPAMLDMWQRMTQEPAFLIAPDAHDLDVWSLKHDGQAYLDAVLSEAAKVHAIDMERIYLVGHSGGANHALRLANRGAGPWRAVAVHAGATAQIEPQPEAIPVLIIVGDRDQSFPIARVRQSARTLAGAGHDVDLRVIPGHNHWFYAIGPDLGPVIWDFLSRS